MKMKGKVRMRNKKIKEKMINAAYGAIHKRHL